jgi:hypothetical protein
VSHITSILSIQLNGHFFSSLAIQLHGKCQAAASIFRTAGGFENPNRNAAGAIVQYYDGVSRFDFIAPTSPKATAEVAEALAGNPSHGRIGILTLSKRGLPKRCLGAY